MFLYARDHEDLLPVAGGRGTKWGAGLRNWAAGNRSEAFGLDPNGVGGEATISSSLYLLVRYGYEKPQTFLCKGDSRVKEFTPAAYGLHDKGFTEVWDFGPDSAKHCSYAYQMVYYSYASKLKMSDDPPCFVIAADRNPWMGKKAKEFSRFEPDIEPFQGTRDRACLGNAATHYGEGQNVMFLNTIAGFEKRPYCGFEDDNIYTSWDGKDSPPARKTPSLSMTCLPRESED
jgi:hypothetical protein